MAERPWTLGEVRGYLERHGIAVVVEHGVPSFERPPTMDRATFVDRLSEVGAHAKRLRAELIASFESGGAGWVDSTPPVDWAEVRRLITRDLLELRAAAGGRLAWYSLYDRTTGYLAPDAKVFPATATHARLIITGTERDGLPAAMTMPYLNPLLKGECVRSLGTRWTYLPWSTPKLTRSKALQAKVYRTPLHWRPPPHWNQPQRWIPAKPSKKYLAKKWAEKWKHELPPTTGDLPD